MSDSVIENKVHTAFSQYPRRVYDKGQLVILGGEDPEYVYYLVKGKVREYGITYRGDEVIVNLFKPHAFFPMSWALNRTANDYFYKTEEQTELHIIPADVAVAFLKSNPDIALDLLSRVYRGVDGLLGKVVQLMSGTARSRLAHELIVECQRFGIQQAASFQLGITESDLAARSGLTRETVNREIQKFKREHYVDVSTKGILVTNLAKLNAIVHSD